MNTEHTTETWTAFQNPEDIGSNYWRIRVADGLKDSLHGYCGEGRARLITAAPDLLAALKATWKILDAAGLTNLATGVQTGSIAWYCKASDAEQQSRAAIAKAEGKA